MRMCYILFYIQNLDLVSCVHLGILFFQIRLIWMSLLCIYRYVGILKLDKGSLGCCQRQVVVYKTEDTSSWLNTIYMEMKRFHQTEQNLNILIDIPICKKNSPSFISFVDFPIVCMITTLLQLQNFPQCLFFQKKLCIYNIYTYIHKQYLQHNFCKRRVVLLLC